MPTTIRWALAALFLSRATTASAGSCPQEAPVAFVNVSLLTMETPELLPGRTVLVRDGTVAAIDPADLPAGTCRIDGAGRVLMPGLSDVHVHTSEREMPLFLANGVTLAREMNGTPQAVLLRERIARGEVPGPRLLVTSPLLAGVPIRNVRFRLVTSAEEATAAAREAKAAGYDFLKVYDGLPRAAYDALVDAGRQLGLRLDGHVPADVGLARVLDARQDLQHMDKLAFALAGHSMDTTRFVEARALFRGRNAWVTPTLASLRALDMARSTDYAAALARPEMAYVDSGSHGWWSSLSGAQPPGPRSRFYQYESALLRVLRETDARFLLGTDAANPLMVAGYSVHDELDALMRDGGLSAWDALSAATRNVGEWLGEPLLGRLVVGAPASLILVDGDPLADMAALRTPAGVMVAGRWYARADLDRMLAPLKLR